MTAILKVKVSDLTTDWIEQIKSSHGDSEIEVRIKAIPKESLSDNRFWAIVDSLDWEAEDGMSIIEPAVAGVSKLSIAEIYAFQEILTHKLYQLDTPQHAKAIGEAAYQENYYFSVDNFLYARACVVANGEETYNAALNEPKEMPKDITFEPILRIASDAYERKTGRSFYYVASVSYETYSNKEAWKIEAQ